MENFLTYFIVGFLGGIVRGLVGFVKNKTIEKTDHFKPSFCRYNFDRWYNWSSGWNFSRHGMASFIFNWIRWNGFH